MFWNKKEKSPQERIRNAEKNKQKLRDKRSKTSSEEKRMKINKKIHEQNVEIRIAEKELENPAHITNKKTTNVNLSANYNKTESGVHLHGHYHASDKKRNKIYTF